MNNNQLMVIDHIENNRTSSYPIPNERLEKAEEYLKNNYLKGLSILLVQSTGVSEVSRSFFNRILIGTKSKQNQQDFLRQAYEIKAEDFEKIIEVLKENPLKYRFVVDALLMCNVDQYSSEQMKLVAGLMECLALTKKEADYLVKISRAILLQDSSEYRESDKIRPKSINWELFLDYGLKFVNGIFIDTEDILAISFVEKSEFKNIVPMLQEKKVIFINNATIEFDGRNTFLEGVEKFVFQNSYLYKNEKSYGGFIQISLQKDGVICIKNSRTDYDFSISTESYMGQAKGKMVIENFEFREDSKKERYIKYQEDTIECVSFDDFR